MKLKLQKIIIAWLKSSGEYNSLVYELSQKLLTEEEEIERLNSIIMDGDFNLDNLIDLIIKEYEKNKCKGIFFKYFTYKR